MDSCAKGPIVILGAGGIGCYYGARLLAAGQEVLFVARGAHLAVLQAQGLCLHHPEFDWQGPVQALDLETLTQRWKPQDIAAVLLCVKATATESVARALAEWFDGQGGETMVVSLQNGVDNEPMLVKHLGESAVIGGLAVRIGGHIVAPGRIEATGIAQIVAGPWPGSGGAAERQYGERLAWLIEVLCEAGIPARQVDDIRRELWRKLVINNGVNPLSALTRMDTRTLSHHSCFSGIVLGLMREAAQAAAADGEILSEDDANEMFELIRNFDPIKTSMLVDLEKGRELEVDAISGTVIERADRLGLAVPHSRTVDALLRHQLEEKAVG
ncbi:ketopantoate reductase family protein [Thiolapillus brandeum]|uniref:2-dehydropantoate 2-reductase n=1 Tax=Thiolapillus brandeum TaxID=1076588 RepID=A0A7U6JI45_9GAMM|nr:2-dehydropantoate 2-reductase [Thiolapillus brandeum]BAO43855.1 2-dehydropantoate 2-reductase [Thiolapillus brandeum]